MIYSVKETVENEYLHLQSSICDGFGVGVFEFRSVYEKLDKLFMLYTNQAHNQLSNLYESTI